MISILCIILETDVVIFSKFSTPFYYLEIFTITIFTIEYITRLWICTEDPKYSHPIWGRLKYLISPLAIFDLLSIIPFYIPSTNLDLRFLRALRLFRLFRVLKLGHYSQSFKILAQVIKKKKEELFITLFAGFIVLVIAASLMYLVEGNVQPDKFNSIPSAMWWGVATLTTVGYGDIYPITPLGKFLGTIIAVLGVGLFVLPAGVLASGFSEELNKKNLKAQICPHCGRTIDYDN